MEEFYRKILSAAIFQHSTKVQPFKQSSLDRIIERIILCSDQGSLTIEEIQKSFIEIIGYSIPVSVFVTAIERLTQLKSLILIEDGNEKYELSKSRKKELSLIEEVSNKREQKVFELLFKNAPNGKDKYEEPFWFALSFIFSNVGEYSAKIVSGTVDKETVLFPLLKNCLVRVKEKFELNFEYFEKRLLHFFSELNEPIYNETKCILTQNHFIAKSIGINPDSVTFSAELFKDKVFYLDTNVILAIISQHNRKHNNAISFIKAANHLELNFCIAHITTKEYETWIDGEFERIRKTKDQIPLKTQAKIASPVYQDYYERYSELEKVQSDVDADKVLSEIENKYQNYKEILSDLIPSERLEYVDDLWFDSVEKDKDFDFFVKHVKEKYSEVSNIRQKGDNAAVHDAKVLLWLEKISKTNPDKYLFVSTDTSLPLIKFNPKEKSKNINLEAVLQWIIPITNSHIGRNIDHVLAEILKQKILPREFMFEIKDFLIFDDLQMECKELPHEDVENCILHLKTNVSELDPNSAEDREKLASEIAKYFIDPSRKYQKELSEKEQENEDLKNQLGDVFKAFEDLKAEQKKKNSELIQTKEKHKEELKAISDEHKEEIENVNLKLQSMSNQLGDIKKNNIEREVRAKLKKWKKPGKISFMIFILIVTFGILEFLPDWGWNYPAKLLKAINTLEESNAGLFRLAIGVNLVFLGTVIIGLFAFSYSRLFNKDKTETKEELIREKITKRQQ